MHYLAHTAVLNCAKVGSRGLEAGGSIPLYDCSRKECVFIVILKCGYLSVCQRVDVSGLLGVRE